MRLPLAIGLGKRFERLLFFSVPVSLAGLLLLFVAVASVTQENRINARCLNDAARAFETVSLDLAKKWKNRALDESSKEEVRSYGLELKIALIYEADLSSKCDETLDEKIDAVLREMPPEEIVQSLRAESAEMSQGPFRIYGVELPEQTALNFLGTEIKVQVSALVHIAQVVLVPVMLIWLGSLFNTRYRESLLIGKSERLVQIFPHVLNVYPAGPYQAPKKRSWITYYSRHFVLTWCTCVRIALLLIFIGPPILSYLVSLYLVPLPNYPLAGFALGSVVAIFSFVTLLVEVMPWHAGKIFADVDLAEFSK